MANLGNPNQNKNIGGSDLTVAGGLGLLFPGLLVAGILIFILSNAPKNGK